MTKKIGRQRIVLVAGRESKATSWDRARSETKVLQWFVWNIPLQP